MSPLQKEYSLNFDIQSFWHVGSGIEAGAYSDALVIRDTSGLPYLPGKSIKGLLKEAFQTAGDNQWFDDQTLIAALFGEGDWSGSHSQGLLQISNAELTPAEKAYFDHHPEAKKLLYNVVQSTAIDPDTGVASETSLRSSEVVVPMNLTAEVALNQGHPGYDQFASEFGCCFADLLERCVALIFSLGAKRHRGFGDVIVSVHSKVSSGGVL